MWGRRRLVIAAGIAALLLTGSATVNAGPSGVSEAAQVLGPDFRISGGVAVDDEYLSAVAYNSVRNEYLVIWMDHRAAASRGADIYGQRVAADGRRLGSNFRISGGAAVGDEQYPAVVYNSVRNQYLVVWSDRRAEATRGADIYGQRVAADGRLLGSNFRISGGVAVGDEQYPAVVYNSVRNQYLVVWEDERANASRGTDIYGQRVAATGRLLGSNFRICGDASTEQDSLPAVTHNSVTNQYLVVWMDYRDQADRDADIYGQRVAATGRLLRSEFRISGTAAISRELLPAVAWNGADNEYLVVWGDWRRSQSPPSDSDIYGQRLAATGRRLGANFRIVAGGAGEPEVAYSAISNRYLVVWQELHIHGRRVSADGATVGARFQISGPGATWWEQRPEVAWGGTDNQYLVVWGDLRDYPTRGSDIYGRRVAG